MYILKNIIYIKITQIASITSLKVRGFHKNNIVVLKSTCFVFLSETKPDVDSDRNESLHYFRSIQRQKNAFECCNVIYVANWDLRYFNVHVIFLNIYFSFWNSSLRFREETRKETLCLWMTDGPSVYGMFYLSHCIITSRGKEFHGTDFGRRCSALDTEFGLFEFWRCGMEFGSNADAANSGLLIDLSRRSSLKYTAYSENNVDVRLERKRTVSSWPLPETATALRFPLIRRRHAITAF